MIKNIIYISPRDVRKNRSDAVHIMLCCNAFQTLNINIELVTPKVHRKEYIVTYKDIFNLYNLEKNFSIKELPTKLTENQHNASSPIKIAAQKFYHFSIYFWKNRRALRTTDTIIYSKCFISSVPFLFLKKMKLVSSMFVFEAASVNKSLLHRFVYRNSDRIIAGLKYTMIDIIKYTGTDVNKFIKPPLLLLLNTFQKTQVSSKSECRKELKLDNDKKYVLYAGKTGKGLKQVEYFIECARLLTQFEFILLGANEVAQAHYLEVKKKYNINNLKVYPFVPLKEYYAFTKAADLLVDYYPATYYNNYYLGPGKASSYLTSGNPVLFSDLPSLRYLFPDEVVFFVQPDNVELFSNKIIEIFENEEECKRKAKNASAFAEEHSYAQTVKKILEFIQTPINVN